MSLTTLKPLLEDAKKKRYAVGAFNVLSIETVRGIIRAAEELNSPVILQLAEVHIPYAPIEYMAPVMLEAAQKASVPVAVHFDHGTSFENIATAIKYGFSSVMFDGASYPLEDNIRLTQEIVKLGQVFGVTVEAELGQVGAAESGNNNIDRHLTDIEEATKFTRNTLIDALAVSIGNLHGQYIETPMLRFDRLKKINDCTVGLPLVLHGGSGITEKDFRTCIENGIHKINICTALLNSSTEKVSEYCITDNKPDYFSIMNLITESTYKVAKKHICIFKSDGKSLQTR